VAAQTATRTNAARLTNSSGRSVHSTAFASAKGVCANRFAQLVADLPAVEDLGPAVHLILGHAFTLIDQRGEDASLANRFLPEDESKFVIVADAFGQPPQRRQADTEGGSSTTEASEGRETLRLARLPELGRDLLEGQPADDNPAVTLIGLRHAIPRR
jgi:hypothetical protein